MKGPTARIATTERWYREHADWWRPLKRCEFWEFYRRSYKPPARATGW